eukprot:GHUV01046071.1.p1 GENE.GHUV01046071.1~~GHUV01046071.1.p1  ORF type:complete len:124 (+),score=7.19 GHUV01046071.1:126-497(+)
MVILSAALGDWQYRICATHVHAGGFESLQSIGEYESLLRTKFAGIPEKWIQNIAEQVSKQKPSPAGDVYWQNWWACSSTYEHCQLDPVPHAAPGLLSSVVLLVLVRHWVDHRPLQPSSSWVGG